MNRLVIRSSLALCSMLAFLTGCMPVQRETGYRQLSSERAVKAERSQFRHELIDHTIENALKQPLAGSTEQSYMGAFWAMGLLRYTSDVTDSAAVTALKQFEQRSPAFRRALLEMIITAYPHRFDEPIAAIANNTTANTKLFSMCVFYLTREGTADLKNQYAALMRRRFPNWRDDPILTMLEADLTNRAGKKKRPPLADWFTAPFFEGETVVFSLQREDRRYPGCLIIRNRDGDFLRTNDGTLFHVGQLALSASQMPPYLTNGNTPQGVYALEGFTVSDNVFIGPTPTVQTRLPFEIEPQAFFRDTSFIRERWRRGLYEQCLPASWRDYLPAYEAYYAGKAGRTEIIAHGTTIDPEFYEDAIFYPFTPSLGCLTTFELWNPRDGVCSVSGQWALVQHLKKMDAGGGYMVVLELDDRPAPVSLTEVLPAILKAEQMNNKSTQRK